MRRSNTYKYITFKSTLTLVRNSLHNLINKIKFPKKYIYLKI